MDWGLPHRHEGRDEEERALDTLRILCRVPATWPFPVPKARETRRQGEWEVLVLGHRKTQNTVAVTEPLLPGLAVIALPVGGAVHSLAKG